MEQFLANQTSGRVSILNEPQQVVVSDEGGSLDDGDVEMPQIEEIEESVRVKKPLRRTTFRSRKMMGNTIYRGGDRIKPVNWCFTIVTASMIVIPSLGALTVV